MDSMRLVSTGFAAWIKIQRHASLRRGERCSRELGRIYMYTAFGSETQRPLRRTLTSAAGLVGLVSAALLMAPDAGFAAPSAINVVEMTIDGAQAGMKAKRFTSRELTQAFLDRIATYNPTYHAIITLNPGALADANVQDRRRATAEPLGPLAGVPVVVKDTMDFAGLPTTAGWAPLSRRAGGVDLIPERDSAVVARLRAAGAVILGKTNVPVFSVSGENTKDSWAGSTLNAAAPDRDPGASSAGTGTSVAASFAVLGLGEETGGSIQNPAAAQALVGVKPTFGLVPNVGVVPLGGSTRDVVGPLARTVRDAALTLDVLAGYTPEDPKTVASFGHMPQHGYTTQLGKVVLRSRRIGIFGPGWMKSPLTADTRRLYESVIARLRRFGAIIVEDPFADSDFASIAEVSGAWAYDQRGEESVAYDLNGYLVHLGRGAAVHSLGELIARTGKDPFAESGPLAYERAQPEFLESLADPSRVPSLQRFRSLRERYLNTFRDVMDSHHLDALVFPQALSETPLLASDANIIPTSVSPINIAGLPVICVPAGYYPSGTPFGIVFIGRLWDEAALLGLAYDWERQVHARRSPTLIARNTATAAH
jgi:Asp-tRNA(Asn)/Glu-tRNA(Gln) amidotransferase A subunit family amidase